MKVSAQGKVLATGIIVDEEIFKITIITKPGWNWKAP